MKKPNLFLVGQPKSGTTALHSFLGQHPDIYMSEVKAPYFFCKDFHQESDNYHKSKLFYDIRDEDDYLQLFSGAGSEKIVGESSDHSIYSKVAAEEIYKFNPEAKIIILLREPVNFLYSLHNQYVRITQEEEEDFSKALALEPLRIQGKFISPRIMCPSFLYYSKRVEYYNKVKRFYDVFEPNQIKTIIYEDFRADNDKNFREILHFLEIDTNVSAQYKSVNAGKEVRFKQLNYLLNNQVFKNTLRKVLSPKNYDFIVEEIVARFLWKKSDKSSKSSSQSPEIRDELMKAFKPEVIKISQLIGVDLERKWGYDRF